MKIATINATLFSLILSFTLCAQSNFEPALYAAFEMPKFKGCESVSKQDWYKCMEEKLGQFVGKNLVYPVEARQNNTQGMVVINFIVEKDGTMSNPYILKNLGSGCGDEALRIVKLMPKWTPGRDEDGNKVRVQFNFPIRFKLDDGDSTPNPPVKRTGYVNFTLNNRSNSSYSVFMPMGLVAIPPRSSRRVTLEEGYQLRCKKRSKEITLFTVNSELEGKEIDLRKTIKKGVLQIKN